VFPKICVCLDCGFSRFTTPANELAEIAIAAPAAEFQRGDNLLRKTAIYLPRTLTRQKPEESKSQIVRNSAQQKVRKNDQPNSHSDCRRPQSGGRAVQATSRDGV
jgi:hypothetical protein